MTAPDCRPAPRRARATQTTEAVQFPLNFGSSLQCGLGSPHTHIQYKSFLRCASLSKEVFRVQAAHLAMRVAAREE